MIGGNVDLDLLFKILKNEQESWGESKDMASSSNGIMEVRGVEELVMLKVEERLFIAKREK